MIRAALERTGLLIRVKKIYYAAEARLNLRRTTALYSHVCGRGDLVFDVGANLGQKTQVFLSMGARVVAVEPEQLCCDYLSRRYRRCDRVTVVRAAVSDAPGQMTLFVSPQTPEISTLDADWLTSGPDKDKAGRVETQQVEVLTLMQLIDRFGEPDYLKIDVEGSETRVLQGLRTPVRHLSFEFHVDNVKDVRARCRIVGALGGYVFNYTLGNTYTLALASWVGEAELLSAIGATGREMPRWGDVFARRLA